LAKKWNINEGRRPKETRKETNGRSNEETKEIIPR
jgi:hypothetical protein